MSKQRRVVLIDAIDKAPRDLPNDLLQEMDQGGFEIAEIDSQFAADDGLNAVSRELLGKLQRAEKVVAVGEADGGNALGRRELRQLGDGQIGRAHV